MKTSKPFSPLVLIKSYCFDTPKNIILFKNGSKEDLSHMKGVLRMDPNGSKKAM